MPQELSEFSADHCVPVGIDDVHIVQFLDRNGAPKAIIAYLKENEETVFAALFLPSVFVLSDKTYDQTDRALEQAEAALGLKRASFMNGTQTCPAYTKMPEAWRHV